MNPFFIGRQQGFTLVEVLVVLMVIVALSSITLEMTSEFAFQNRYEITKDRHERIKEAILGDPDILVGEQPSTSGFVADVGRLPFALQELLDGNFCTDTRYFNSADCATAGETWAVTPNWNGPYLSSNKPFNDPKAIPDGWGNSGSGNYGWNVHFYDSVGNEIFNAENAVSMSIQSPGAANVPDYGDPYPSDPEISETDWTVDIGKVKVRLMANFSGACGLGTAEYEHICKNYNGSWDSLNAKCQINNEYLCTAILNETWIAGTSTCQDASSNPITEVPYEKLCDWSSGTWDSINFQCNDIPKNLCWGNIGQNAWSFDVNNGLCLTIIRNSSSISSSLSPFEEDGREYLKVFDFIGLSLPAGEAIGMIFDGDCTASTTTYQSNNPKSICIDTLDHSNFTQVHCENDNGGTWIDDGTEKYCDGVIGSECTGSAGTDLGGTEHPKFHITLNPYTSLPTTNW